MESSGSKISNNKLG